MSVTISLQWVLLGQLKVVTKVTSHPKGHSNICTYGDFYLNKTASKVCKFQVFPMKWIPKISLYSLEALIHRRLGFMTILFSY